MDYRNIKSSGFLKKNFGFYFAAGFCVIANENENKLLQSLFFCLAWRNQANQI
jgi:hypothetical protein